MIQPLLVLLLLLQLLDVLRGETLHTLQAQFPVSAVDGDRLVCQLFTDTASAGAILYAADDFVVPAALFNATPADAARHYTALEFTLGLVRTRRDTDPESVTLQLMRDNNGAPGSTFFVRAITDGGGVRWNETPLERPFNVTLRLQYGDANQQAGRATLFDPMNARQLPRDTRLWLAVYATGPRNFIPTGGTTYAENCVYWAVTGVNASGTMQLNTTNATAPRPYYFIDPADTLREGFTQWTRADAVERAMQMSVGHYNMAWSVALVSNATQQAPSSSSPSPPLLTPSAPAPVWDENNVSWPPIDNYTGAPTPYNSTIVVWGVNVTLRSVLLAVLLPLSLLACLCGSLWVLVQHLKRRALKKENTMELVRLDRQYRNEKSSGGGDYSPVDSGVSFVDISDGSVMHSMSHIEISDDDHPHAD